MIRADGSQKFYGMKYEGVTYDTGSKVGFLMANVAYALERAELGRASVRKSKRFLRQG